MDKTILTSNEAVIRIFPYGGNPIQTPYHRNHNDTPSIDCEENRRLNDDSIDHMYAEKNGKNGTEARSQWIDMVMSNHHRVATQSVITGIPIHLDGVWVEYDSGVHRIEGDVFVIPAGKTIHFLSIEEITVSSTVYGTVFPYIIVHPHEHPLFISPIQVIPTYIKPNTTHRIHVYVTNMTNKPREIYVYRPVAYVRFDRIVT